jgi:hypothetical protein
VAKKAKGGKKKAAKKGGSFITKRPGRRVFGGRRKNGWARPATGEAAPGLLAGDDIPPDDE